ncbi:MAG: Yip1 family protein [Aestuariivita sp.]|nr:Yip1 family protein [Aestuariivita sp.]
MTSTEVLTLFIYLSIKNPARAARRLIDFRITRQMLWCGLILVAILNTLTQQFSNFMVPGPPLLSGITDMAFIYFLFVIGGLLSIVFAIYFVGRTFGGQGSINDVMVVIIWLQFLRLLVQILVLFFLFFKLPTLSLLVVLAATIFGFWILTHFVNQAHSFESLGKSVLILVASFGGLLVAWSLLASIVGFGLMGTTRV